PTIMGGVGGHIVEKRIGADFAKALRNHQRFDEGNQLRGNALSPMLRPDEDPFEERDRVGVAAVDVVSDCNLGESQRAAAIGLGNEATIGLAAEAFDPWEVFLRRFLRPKLAA